MRTETIEQKIYDYQDVVDDVDGIKSKVLSELLDINTDDNWYEDDFSFIKEKALTERGIQIDTIRFSGFCSQGDGASILGSINIKDFCKLHNITCRFMTLADRISIDIVQKTNGFSAHYVHENTVETDVNIDIDEDATPNIYEALETLSVQIEEALALRSTNKDIYKQLNDQWDYLRSEKGILETIEANEYEFTNEGKIF